MQKPPYRQEAGHWLIELRLGTPRQLFNTIDPSPFHEKDLDEAAERYILEAVEDFHEASALQLVIHLPPEHVSATTRDQLASAISHYFGWRAHEVKRELLHCLRDGRLSLVIGLGFLFFCNLLRSLVTHYLDGFVANLLDDGLLIIGWVALWRPIQTFLYDWWPIYRRMRTFRRITRLDVRLCATP